MSTGKPKKLRVLSDAGRKAISEAQKRRWADPEQRKKQSELVIRLWASEKAESAEQSVAEPD